MGWNRSSELLGYAGLH